MYLMFLFSVHYTILFIKIKSSILSKFISHINKLLFILFLLFANYAKSQLNLNFPAFHSANSFNINNYQGSSILLFFQNQIATNTPSTTSVLWNHTGASIKKSTMRTPFGVTF